MFNIEEELKKLPSKPGVYIMHDKNGEIILNTLFEYEEIDEDEKGKVQGRLYKKGELVHKEKLMAAGFPV